MRPESPELPQSPFPVRRRSPKAPKPTISSHHDFKRRGGGGGRRCDHFRAKCPTCPGRLWGASSVPRSTAKSVSGPQAVAKGPQTDHFRPFRARVGGGLRPFLTRCPTGGTRGASKVGGCTTRYVYGPQAVPKGAENVHFIGSTTRARIGATLRKRQGNNSGRKRLGRRRRAPPGSKKPHYYCYTCMTALSRGSWEFERGPPAQEAARGPWQPR